LAILSASRQLCEWLKQIHAAIFLNSDIPLTPVTPRKRPALQSRNYHSIKLVSAVLRQVGHMKSEIIRFRSIAFQAASRLPPARLFPTVC
jgi:hypothetical protein